MGMQSINTSGVYGRCRASIAPTRHQRELPDLMQCMLDVTHVLEDYRDNVIPVHRTLDRRVFVHPKDFQLQGQVPCPTIHVLASEFYADSMVGEAIT